jgi:hypothetical protein
MGLATPDEADMEQYLHELKIGASGEYRYAPPLE